MQMAEREFSVITLYFTSTVVSCAPGQLFGDLQKRFLEDLWQLSTCHLQNPPIFFADRLTLVKDSFGGMDNRCQSGPSRSMAAQGKYWRRRKATFFFFSPALTCHISSSSCEGILDRTSHLNNAKHRLDRSLYK